ncbi:MAG TPA: TfoX/Sxy family protein [Paracoccaceae bacterium]|nr:TfoX/Sxy family protein [Paracoccaceae bacterium]
MAVSDEERENARDLFAGLGPVEVRRMFGGAGVWFGDACFALLVDGSIWMRADEALGRDFASAGSEQWVYEGRRRAAVTMPYWRLPDSALDDADEAAAWARRSLVPAERAAAEKRAAKARRSAGRGHRTARTD